MHLILAENGRQSPPKFAKCFYNLPMNADERQFSRSHAGTHEPVETTVVRQVSVRQAAPYDASIGGRVRPAAPIVRTQWLRNVGNQAILCAKPATLSVPVIAALCVIGPCMDLSWITSPEAWKAIGLGIASRGIWAVGAFALAGGFGAFARDRRKFSGRWKFIIRWTPDYAENLFGSRVPDPHSVGNVSMTFGVGEHKNQYWGLAYFQLKAATQQYAQLCVEFYDVKVRRRFLSKEFPWVFVNNLESMELHSMVREKTREFEYGPWVQYQMKFTKSSGKSLAGKLVLLTDGQAVADVVATRSL